MNDSQRIRRLTPLKDAIAALDALARPVAAHEVEPGDAIGQILAADVIAASWPRRATALRDGWAIKAGDVADAGAYAPVSLASMPHRVEIGDEMPAGTDAIAPVEAVLMRGQAVEVVNQVTAGDGVATPGSEIDASRPLRKVGERLRAVDIAILAAGEVTKVKVRAPRCLIVTAREDLRLMPVAQMIARDCAARGGIPVLRYGIELGDALRLADCDAIIVVGGTGTGLRDASVQALARLGSVAVHGVGLIPGETAAFGSMGGRPVLIVPGRIDGALAGWLVLGRRMLQLLAGDFSAEFPVTLTLSRKVTSIVGMAEVVPVRCDGNNAEPLASGSLPLWALARANGWLLVPPDSEGYPAGVKVAINTMP